jgi:hypothetical protein
MFSRCGEMMKYSAHAPLVLKTDQAQRLESVAEVKRAWKELAEGSSSPRVGRMIHWLRPVARGLQRVAKETLLLFILIGAIALFIASPRRALLLSIVPLYYFVFQSPFHTEFRYTLPMQYFMFVFAACGWVLIAAGSFHFAKALKARIPVKG